MKWWKGTPWRLIQTNLSEMDFKGLDPERYAADAKEFGATVVMLSAGGISAHYDSSLTWQGRNSWAEDGVLEQVVKCCHERDIHVIARVDFSKVKKEIFLKNPQWAFRTAGGEIMEYNGYVQTCINSDYQQEYAFHILEEIFTRIPFDGLYCNMGGFQTKDYDFRDYGFCHCAACRAQFRAAFGKEIPEQADLTDAGYRDYLDFQRGVVAGYRKKMAEYLRQLGKRLSRDLCFDDVDYGRIEASTEISRRLPHWPYHASSNCRAVLGDGSSGIICSDASVDFMGYALRNVGVSPWLQALREWQNLANLGGLDYYLMGRIDNHEDRRGFSAVKRVFQFQKAHEQAYAGLKNKAKVLLRRSARWEITDEEKGWVRTLTERHIPFGEILPEEYETADLSRYSVVILPDSRNITDREMRQSEEFARDGGTLIVSGQTGYLCPPSKEREDFLRCLGIRQVKDFCTDMLSACFQIRDTEKRVFSSFADCDVAALGDRYQFLEMEPEAKGFLAMVPAHTYGPPECCYYTAVTGEPACIEFAWGRGKTITVPWFPGELYSRTGFDNPALFMGDVLKNLGGCESLSESLSPMVEVTYAEKGTDWDMVQLVNTSGCFSLSFFAPVPMEAIELQIPCQEPPEQVFALAGGKTEWRLEKDRLVIQLDILREYEAILIKKHGTDSGSCDQLENPAGTDIRSDK